VEYALNDTRHLQPLSELLKAELQQKGRLTWLEEICTRLIAECAQSRPESPALVWRVRGSDRLDRPALAVLRELWKWRESEAQRTNRPPYFILSHELLTAISVAA